MQPFSTKYSTASTSSRFSHLLLFPARGNNGSMIVHWLSLKSLAYLRRSFFCIMLPLYHFPLIGTSSEKRIAKINADYDERTAAGHEKLRRVLSQWSKAKGIVDDFDETHDTRVVA